MFNTLHLLPLFPITAFQGWYYCFDFIYLFIFKDFINLFLRRGEGREKERERNISMVASHMPRTGGTWPTTQACALTGN